ALGSVAVTPTFPRDTNIQPSVPSNRTPLGYFPLISITTSFGYNICTSKSPWTFHKPLVGKSAHPSASNGPLNSVPIPQCAISKWCDPHPVIIPAPNCSQRNQPGRSLISVWEWTRSSVYGSMGVEP